MIHLDEIIEINEQWFECAEHKNKFWHTSAHILCQAVLRLFPDAKPVIGPAIDSGFFYDFGSLNIKEHDLNEIEKMCYEIIDEALDITSYTLRSKKDALELYKDNKYKQEIIKSFPDDEIITVFSQGEFHDMCRGPHLDNTKYVKAIKILRMSSAYFKGDKDLDSLTRIYGISFPNKQMLDDHLKFLDEITKRDHRILGKHLKIFMFSEFAPGFPLFLPNGIKILNSLHNFWKTIHDNNNYIEISTPAICSIDLWKISGHADHYIDNMFTFFDHEDQKVKSALKAMNCPGAMLFFESEQRSYKDLPLRVSEKGSVFRNEHSGALSGLCRVKNFHQDDAHIFVSKELIEGEVSKILSMVDDIYKSLNITYKFELATKPENSCGTLEEWEESTKALNKILENTGKEFKIREGDGAFYGPKIDIYIKDAISRVWQCGTIQLDFGIGSRFNLKYTNAQGLLEKPIVIHRAIFGSFERFLGILIEHFSGKMPLWISPYQIAIIPVTESHINICDLIKRDLYKIDCNADIIDTSETLGKRIRNCRNNFYNYIIVIGDNERDLQHLSVKSRDADNKIFYLSYETFMLNIKKEIQDRLLRSIIY